MDTLGAPLSWTLGVCQPLGAIRSWFNYVNSSHVLRPSYPLYLFPARRKVVMVVVVVVVAVVVDSVEANVKCITVVQCHVHQVVEQRHQTPTESCRAADTPPEWTHTKTPRVCDRLAPRVSISWMFSRFTVHGVLIPILDARCSGLLLTTPPNVCFALPNI
jgi:hypothetical protein